jgi:hypothetical protein
VDDPFAVLGLPPTATLDDVRAARRRLAKSVHPDHGGDEARMRDINRAFDLAVKAILRPPTVPAPTAPAPTGPPPSGPGPSRASRSGRRVGRRIEQDSPSFSIDLLPAEAFEALLVVVSWIGDVLVDDPPYLLDALLREPQDCWCRIELLPEAGASMVSLTVAGLEGEDAPPVDEVRDLLVTMLNQLGEP